MPGNVAPVAPLGPLPAIPAATAGIPTGIGVAAGELAQAASQVPEEINRQKLENAEIAKAQEQVKAATQSQAMTRLQYLVSVGQSSPDKLPYDPSYRKAVDQAVRDAGILDAAPTIEEPMLGSPTMRTKVDINALIPMRSPADLTATEWQTLDASSPDQKRAKVKAMRVAMPEDYLNQPARYDLSSPQRVIAMQQFQKNYESVTSGQMTPEQFQNWLQFAKTDINAVYGEGAAANLTTDPTILAGLGKMNQAKLDQLTSAGLKAGAEAYNASSFGDLHAAQAKYYTEKTNLLPIQTQQQWTKINDMVHYHDGLLENAQNRINSALEIAKTKGGAQAATGLRDAVNIAKSAYEAADHDYQSALSKVATRDNNGMYTLNDATGISQEETANLAAAKKRRDDLKSSYEQAEKLIPTVLQSGVQQFLGTNRTATNVHEPGQPPNNNNAPAAKGTIPRARIEAYAKQQGISVDAAIQDAQRRGYTIGQ